MGPQTNPFTGAVVISAGTSTSTRYRPKRPYRSSIPTISRITETSIYVPAWRFVSRRCLMGEEKGLQGLYRHDRSGRVGSKLLRPHHYAASDRACPRPHRRLGQVTILTS